MTFPLIVRPENNNQTALVPAASAPVAAASDEMDACRVKEESIRRQIQENCPYVSCFRGISYEYRDGMLTVRGRLPSYYLKQLLHMYLRNFVHDAEIRDEVDVVSASGLSSVRPR